MYGSTKGQNEDIALVKKDDSVINMGQKINAPEYDESEEFMKNPFGDEEGNSKFWDTVCISIAKNYFFFFFFFFW